MLLPGSWCLDLIGGSEGGGIPSKLALAAARMIAVANGQNAWARKKGMEERRKRGRGTSQPLRVPARAHDSICRAVRPPASPLAGLSTILLGLAEPESAPCPRVGLSERGLLPVTNSRLVRALARARLYSVASLRLYLYALRQAPPTVLRSRLVPGQLPSVSPLAGICSDNSDSSDSSDNSNSSNYCGRTVEICARPTRWASISRSEKKPLWLHVTVYHNGRCQEKRNIQKRRRRRRKKRTHQHSMPVTVY